MGRRQETNGEASPLFEDHRTRIWLRLHKKGTDTKLRARCLPMQQPACFTAFPWPSRRSEEPGVGDLRLPEPRPIFTC